MAYQPKSKEHICKQQNVEIEVENTKKRKPHKMCKMKIVKTHKKYKVEKSCFEISNQQKWFENT
jgi:hypothetical protein